jgi:2-polyprenyl-3-methyl-5-hydroxy-6-metoxy-1,4-benzoquinol methylase
MPLFPLDQVRNAQPDRAVEPLLEDLREEIIHFSAWEQLGLGGTAEVVDAFDMARPRLNVLASLLQRAGIRSCLDVSTGLGFLPRLLTTLGINVMATEREIGLARFATQAGIETRRWALGRGQTPVPPSSVEAVVFAEVLEHLKLPARGVIHELATVLRPGGLLLLSTPNIARLAHIEALAAGENFLEPFSEDAGPDTDPTDLLEHVREYSVREVVDAVEGAGLEIRQVLMTGWGEAGYQPLPNPYANEIIVVEAVT